MQTLAQASTEIVNMVSPILQNLGIPGAVTIVLGWTLRKLCLWGRSFWREHAWPWIEKMAQSYIERQAEMASCQKKLTESTIEIQQQVLTAVLRLEEKIPTVCKGK
jgi:hypothetical protein